MKKLIIIIIALLSLPFSNILAASPIFPRPDDFGRRTETASPCAAGEIVINPDRDGGPTASLDKIRKAFSNYATPECFLNVNNRYELRFNFPSGALEINEPLVMQTLDARNLYTYNLKLIKGPTFPAGTPLLEIVNNNTGIVTADGLNLSGVTDGLELAGSGPINVIKSDISGDGTGTCLFFSYGSALSVKSSKIHGCQIGIQDAATTSHIEAVEVHDNGTGIKLAGNGLNMITSTVRNNRIGIEIAGNNMQIGALNDTPDELLKMNIIHDNKQGIVQQAGTENNKFSYNRNYNNMVNHPTSDDAIWIDPSLGIPRPEIELLDPDNPVPEKALEALHCDKDAAERVASRWIQTRQIAEGLEALIYETNDAARNQAVNYLLKCTVDIEGKCPITFPTRFAVSDTQCGVDIKAMVLVNAPNTSMLNEDKYRFKLDGPVVALGGETGIDIPSSTPGALPADLESSEETSGSEMAAGTGGAIEGAGVTVMETGSGAGGTGGTTRATCAFIVPANLPHPSSPYKGEGFMILWWLVFTAPAVLVAVRVRKRK